jgi:hypothetical protein
MWVTSQLHDGISDNRDAFAPEGTEPVWTGPRPPMGVDPEVRPDAYDGRHLVHSEGDR